MTLIVKFAFPMVQKDELEDGDFTGNIANMGSVARLHDLESPILQKESNAWDCTGALRLLGANEARWTTGTILTVDSGATCVELVSET
ncbi:short-chain type dehydrogenase [Penicillium riverlandense]|uniref:short-chain type dehydrogenase n=1 Tax=Penicillium riverlandense TaxID=1903569 RepID=UPI002548A48A|nr:short-chain type dehydrogenase [Penicillium riverlandense]KAJ5805154.1 short-chain type dehydrogenase [Penicillium riverlandense]